MYRVILIRNKVRNVTPPPIPPNVSDKNQKIQAFDGVAILYPTLTMKLVCDSNPTKMSDEDNEHSKVFFGDCRSVGVLKIAENTIRLETTVVIEEIPFAIRRKMEKSALYQEIANCKSRNEHSCSEAREEGISLGVETNVWFNDMITYSIFVMRCKLKRKLALNKIY